ncbi:MAG: RadC family protein [Thermodesulfobacteriota bacterium]
MASTPSNSGHRKRLKDRFSRTSLDGFHDYEVVELLLTFAIPRRDVKPIAKALIKRFGGLKGLFEADMKALSSVSGIGESTAVLLSLFKEAAGAYLLDRRVSRHPPIRSPKDVLDFLDATLAGEEAESFMAIFLNSKNEILGVEVLHEGAISGMEVAPRAVIEKAFKYNARSVIFVHNHPEGDAAPTGGDRKLAQSLKAAASTIDILIHDYLITGGAEHFSAREVGWLGG